MKDKLIESLSPRERDAFAEMVMRSLRGSWSNPRDRVEILKTIADHEVEVYDDVGEWAEHYEDKRGWDGRYFRGLYGEVDLREFDMSLIRRLASHIPHDMTYEDYHLTKIEDGERSA